MPIGHGHSILNFKAWNEPYYLFRMPYVDYADAHGVDYLCFMMLKPAPLPQEWNRLV
jgi:hypothetical protein